MATHCRVLRVNNNNNCERSQSLINWSVLTFFLAQLNALTPQECDHQINIFIQLRQKLHSKFFKCASLFLKGRKNAFLCSAVCNSKYLGVFRTSGSCMRANGGLVPTDPACRRGMARLQRPLEGEQRSRTLRFLRSDFAIHHL